MKVLKKLSIVNLKGYGDEIIFNLSQPTGEEGSGMNIIVGPNNSGKSTIITAIEKLKPNSMIEKSDRKNTEKIVKISLTDNNNNNVIISNPGLGGPMQTSNQLIQEKDILIIKSRRNWESNFSGSYDIDSYSANLSAHSSSNQDSFFGSYLNKIYEDTGKKQLLTESIRRIIPNFHDWKIEYDNGVNYIEYITGEDNIVHNARGLSDGVNNVFKICAFITNIGFLDKDILIIDEPELSLQPSSQKSLFKELLKISKDKQIIIMTHSPNFINLNFIEKGGSIFRLNKGPGKNVVKTQILKSSISDLGGILTRWQRPFIFDIVGKEIFFENNILYVEGQEDVGLIKKFAEENDIKLNFNIFGYGVDGASNIKKFLQISKDLGIKSGALFDGDKSIEYNDSKSCYPEYQDGIFLLPKDDIRDKYYQEVKSSDTRSNEDKLILQGGFKDSSELFKEGIFDKDGVIKTENQDVFFRLISSINTYFE